MESLEYKTSHSSYYMEKLPKVLEWLSGKGMNSHVSRFSRYKGYIDDFYTGYNGLDELEKKFAKHSESIQQCVEIVTIYDAFSNENSNGFISRLREVVKGSDFLCEMSGNDNSRDFQYELLVAAKFQTLGYTIDFDNLTDVVAKREDDILYIECKKIKSIQAFERNYKKAGKQLKSNKPDLAYGLIFIDVFDCVADKIRAYEYNNIIEMKNVVDSALQHFIKVNEHTLEQLNDRFVNNALGVCLTTNKILWLSDVRPQYYKDHKVHASEALSDELYRKLQTVMK